MPIVAKLDELGRPAWIVLVILGFIAWWPAGLVLLAFTIGSGRLSHWRYYGGGGEYWQYKSERLRERAERMRGSTGGGGCGWWGGYQRSSGNRAFDDYRHETLRRLEDEQREFHDFLDRLRQARDKAEFDQFMADRRSRPASPEQPAPTPQV